MPTECLIHGYLKVLTVAEDSDRFWLELQRSDIFLTSDSVISTRKLKHQCHLIEASIAPSTKLFLLNY